MGIMRRALDVEQYPQANKSREREAEIADQDVLARGVK